MNQQFSFYKKQTFISPIQKWYVPQAVKTVHFVEPGGRPAGATTLKRSVKIDEKVRSLKSDLRVFFDDNLFM